MKWPFLEGFLGPNCPKYYLILLKFAPEVAFKERKTVLQKFLENSNFYGNCKLPKFALFFSFCPTLTPFYSMKEAEIEKTKWWIEQNLDIGLSKSRKIKAPSRLHFSGKIRLFFDLFWLIFVKKRGVVTRWRIGIKIWSILLQSHNSWACFCVKSFVPALPSFAATTTKGRFFLIPTHFFKFGCFSRYHAYIFDNNKFGLPMHNLILNQFIAFCKFKN